MIVVGTLQVDLLSALHYMEVCLPACKAAGFACLWLAVALIVTVETARQCTSVMRLTPYSNRITQYRPKRSTASRATRSLVILVRRPSDYNTNNQISEQVYSSHDHAISLPALLRACSHGVDCGHSNVPGWQDPSYC